MKVVLGLAGLDHVQEIVYRAALEAPALDAPGLAERLQLDVAEVRDALEALLQLRMMRRSRDEPGRLVPVDPVVGLQELLAREHEQLLARQQQISASQSMVLRMLADRNTSVPSAVTEGVQRLEGIDAVQQRLERFSQEARWSVATFMPGGAQSAEALEAARENDARVMARGAAVRTVGLDSVRGHEETLAYARWLTDQGSEFRTVSTLPPRMVVVDRSAALVPIDPKDSRKGAMFLTEPGMVASLMALFEQVWDVATPLGSDRRPDGDGLSSQEKALLVLIAQGHTDESAAAKLFISARTARRTMASIMERLGARSRFEAGVKAAQLGWL
ncbi:LuxR C-terminal-related transcriptional regulator [Streptomyces sp. NPDC057623]|uniref:LuxR C-terminal-related transcriptional regulator n=1 Tax=Streptomyces sp. NPDC057623 TaxID=3346187 RepID=UPI0036797662